MFPRPPLVSAISPFLITETKLRDKSLRQESRAADGTQGDGAIRRHLENRQTMFSTVFARVFLIGRNGRWSFGEPPRQMLRYQKGYVFSFWPVFAVTRVHCE